MRPEPRQKTSLGHFRIPLAFPLPTQTDASRVHARGPTRGGRGAVLDQWIVSRSEVCEGEDVVDGKRVYFDRCVEPKPK